MIMTILTPQIFFTYNEYLTLIKFNIYENIDAWLLLTKFYTKCVDDNKKNLKIVKIIHNSTMRINYLLQLG
jgi:hypothetical protein